MKDHVFPGLGGRIKRRREQIGVNRATLAWRLEIRDARLQKFESEQRNPCLDELRRLGEQLNCTIGFLVGEREVPNEHVHYEKGIADA